MGATCKTCRGTSDDAQLAAYRRRNMELKSVASMAPSPFVPHFNEEDSMSPPVPSSYHALISKRSKQSKQSATKQSNKCNIPYPYPLNSKQSHIFHL